MSINKLMPTTSDDGDLEIEELRHMQKIVETYLASGGKVTHLPAYKCSPPKLFEAPPPPRKRGRPPKIVETAPPRKTGRPPKTVKTVD